MPGQAETRIVHSSRIWMVSAPTAVPGIQAGNGGEPVGGGRPVRSLTGCPWPAGGSATEPASMRSSTISGGMADT